MADSENKIVIVTGPESTGKTCIAKQLSEKYGGNYVAEYARSYIEALDRDYNYEDILNIAESQQNEIEKIFSSKESLFWFVDTHLIITKTWFSWHAGKTPSWIDGAIKKTKNCLYLLCAPDIEWKEDSVRENGGMKRLELFNTYKTELEYHKLSYRIVTGENEVRFRNAVTFVEDYWG